MKDLNTVFVVSIYVTGVAIIIIITVTRLPRIHLHCELPDVRQSSEQGVC